MEIHGFAVSPNTWKCRALAAHLGVPLTYVHVDLLKGEQREAAYLALSPSGRTPALVDGDVTLWESTAILHYIASKKPGPVNPTDSASACDVLRWQSWGLAHWEAGACTPLTFQNIVKAFFDMGPPDDDVIASALEAFRKEAAVLDAHLANRKWLVGDDVTLADFSVGAPLFMANDAKMPLGEFPHAAEWFGRLSALPCWSDTAPQMANAA